MFGKKKKKKSPKVEKVFEGSSSEEQVSAAGEEQENQDKPKSDIDEFLGIDETQEEGYLTEKQKEKVEKLNSVKSKISQILRSTNIEIIDENIGDEYEHDGSVASEEKSQQDYDSLKAIFGDKDKSKKQELTLTIDDFDYTHVGQYLDEYDLMHMKNIKRIRLQRKYPKHLKKVLIIASVVLFIGLGVYLGLYLTRDVPVYLKNVTLSQTEHDYFIDEVFDYTGLYIIAEYSDGSTKRVKLNKSHYLDATGRIEKVGDNNDDIQFINGTEAVLTFGYQGFTMDYTINIVKKVEKGLLAIHTNGIFDVPAEGFITSDVISLFVDYGNFGSQEIALSSSKIAVYLVEGETRTQCVYDKANGFKVPEQTTQDSVFEIEYTTDKSEIFKVKIAYEKGKYITTSAEYVQ